MQFEEMKQLFIKILGAELTESTLNSSITENIDKQAILKLYKLADGHNLAHIVSGFFEKAGLLKADADFNPLKKDAITTVFQNRYNDYALSQVFDILNECEIPFIPLKGSVLKLFYPKRDMRTSCDIDILVKEKDIDLAIENLVKKGRFTLEGRYYHDFLLISENQVNLELHFNLQEGIERLDSVLQKAWDYAKPQNGYQYAFKDEFFVFYILAHMAYHFTVGGCGVRSLMDLWVMKHKMGLDFNNAQELLKQAGIYTFAEKITKLSDYCFSDGAKDDCTEDLLYYIVSGGTYGSAENMMTYKKTKTNSTFKYILSRIFIPFNDMKHKYGILNKHPYLLPFLYVVRFFEGIFAPKEAKAFDEIKISKSVKQDKIDKLTAVRDYLEL